MADRHREVVEGEEEESGDWYPGKVTAATKRQANPAPLPPRVPKCAASIEGHAVAAQLFDAYVARRSYSLNQITRLSVFFSNRADDSKRFAAAVTQSSSQLADALAGTSSSSTQSLAPSSNTSTPVASALKGGKIENASAQPKLDSLFVAVDALQKNTAEVQNQHDMFALAVLEDVVAPLKEVIDKYTTTLQPGLQGLHELRRYINRSQRACEKQKAKIDELHAFCTEAANKRNGRTAAANGSSGTNPTATATSEAMPDTKVEQVPAGAKTKDAGTVAIDAGSSTSTTNAFAKFFTQDITKPFKRTLESVQKQLNESRAEMGKLVAARNEQCQNFESQLGSFAVHFESMEHLRAQVMQDCLRKFVIFEAGCLANLQYDVQLLSKSTESATPEDDVIDFFNSAADEVREAAAKSLRDEAALAEANRLVQMAEKSQWSDLQAQPPVAAAVVSPVALAQGDAPLIQRAASGKVIHKTLSSFLREGLRSDSSNSGYTTPEAVPAVPQSSPTQLKQPQDTLRQHPNLHRSDHGVTAAAAVLSADDLAVDIVCKLMQTAERVSKDLVAAAAKREVHEQQTNLVSYIGHTIEADIDFLRTILQQQSESANVDTESSQTSAKAARRDGGGTRMFAVHDAAVATLAWCIAHPDSPPSPVRNQKQHRQNFFLGTSVDSPESGPAMSPRSAAAARDTVEHVLTEETLADSSTPPLYVAVFSESDFAALSRLVGILSESLAALCAWARLLRLWLLTQRVVLLRSTTGAVEEGDSQHQPIAVLSSALDMFSHAQYWEVELSQSVARLCKVKQTPTTASNAPVASEGSAAQVRDKDKKEHREWWRIPKLGKKQQATQQASPPVPPQGDGDSTVLMCVKDFVRLAKAFGATEEDVNRMVLHAKEYLTEEELGLAQFFYAIL